MKLSSTDTFREVFKTNSYNANCKIKEFISIHWNNSFIKRSFGNNFTGIALPFEEFIKRFNEENVAEGDDESPRNDAQRSRSQLFFCKLIRLNGGKREKSAKS